MNGEEHKVDTYGRHVYVDDTLFTIGDKWNEVYHRGNHVYTLHFETYTMEKGKDYQAWYEQDQIPVQFEHWSQDQNIKNIIIDGTVYKIEGAVSTRPILYLQDKQVGYICEGKVIHRTYGSVPPS